MELRLNVDLAEVIDATRQLNNKQAKSLILAIDSNMCEYEFTLSVVKALVKDLKKCVGPEDPPLTAKDIGL